MNRKHFAAGLTALALTVAGNALASNIYKWTDEHGTIHYGDKPSGASSEERLNVSYRRTDQNAVAERIKARHDAQAARAEARASAAEAEQAAAAEREKAEDRRKRCEDTRAKLSSMLAARRVYRENENGEREYLDDEGRDQARQRAEELIEEYCD